MKTIRTTLLATAVLLVGAHAASATTLGTIQFTGFLNGTSPFVADLGGVNPGIADATTVLNEYNGAATLPGGLPVNYDVQIDRTFVGDANTATADALNDRYLFKVDPSTLSGTTANANATITLAIGTNTGLQNTEFSIFQSDTAGTEIGGALGTVNGNGTVTAMLSTSETYILRVLGNLLSGEKATNIGRYDIVYASASVVPLPPAILLLLTGLGALFGVRGLRKRERSAVA